MKDPPYEVLKVNLKDHASWLEQISPMLIWRSICGDRSGIPLEQGFVKSQVIEIEAHPSVLPCVFFVAGFTDWLAEKLDFSKLFLGGPCIQLPRTKPRLPLGVT